MAKIDSLLKAAVEQRVSDVHFSPNDRVWARIDGDLVHFTEENLSAKGLTEMLNEIMSAEEKDRLEKQLNLDKSYFVENVGNFRVNIFMSRRGIGAVIRSLPSKIPTIDDLGLPQVIKNLTELPKGLILVTGPTGSGKSTTLAALINHMNEHFPYHILTVEDPVEFIHQNKQSLVSQREIGQSCHTFADALKYALREDPDVILVGEMRDLETISLAMTAAETGHLVLGTLHTRGAASTIDRIIESFPAMQQPQIRAMLSESLQAVISQTLIKRADNQGRVAAYEIMVMNYAISNLVREGKTFQIPSAIQTGRKEGMVLMENHVKELAADGAISESAAEEMIASITKGGHGNNKSSSSGSNPNIQTAMTGATPPPPMQTTKQAAAAAAAAPAKAPAKAPSPTASPAPTPAPAKSPPKAVAAPPPPAPRPVPAPTPAPAPVQAAKAPSPPSGEEISISTDDMLSLDEMNTGMSDISELELTRKGKLPPQLQTPGAGMKFKPLGVEPTAPPTPAVAAPKPVPKPAAPVPKPVPRSVPNSEKQTVVAPVPTKKAG